jgi:bifunctional non-homologous end joining protein LigD
MTLRRTFGFIEPCLTSKVARPPSGPNWVHEINHDDYRLMVRKDGAQVHCFTRGGHDWARRFPAIADAALRIQATSFLIDGEAVIAHEDGTPDFHALRSKRRGHEAPLAQMQEPGKRGPLSQKPRCYPPAMRWRWTRLPACGAKWPGFIVLG